MRPCKSCQQIPELYEVDLYSSDSDLPLAIARLMDANHIHTMMQTKEEVICARCGTKYNLDIYTEVFRVEFTLKRVPQ
jgi:hypothetical protein